MRQGTGRQTHLQVPRVLEEIPNPPNTPETKGRTLASHGIWSVLIHELNTISKKPLKQHRV